MMHCNKKVATLNSPKPVPHSLGGTKLSTVPFPTSKRCYQQLRGAPWAASKVVPPAAPWRAAVPAQPGRHRPLCGHASSPYSSTLNDACFPPGAGPVAGSTAAAWGTPTALALPKQGLQVCPGLAALGMFGQLRNE